MKAVLDTHALLWWLDAPKRLSREQRRAIDRASAASILWVSDITSWEIAMLVEAGRIKLRDPIDEWLERATAAPAVQRMEITPAILRELTTLSTTRTWDPADRILVATARVLGASLVTVDTRIVESRLVPTV